MGELKPCPFCGSAHIVNDDAAGAFGETLVRYASKCKECGVSFWHPECDEHLNWNTRPVEDQLRRERDEARQQATHYHRRAQKAEALNEKTIDDCRREGVSIGRGLANGGYWMLKDRIEETAKERDAARAELAAAKATLVRALCLLQDAVEGNYMPTHRDLDSFDTRPPLAVVEIPGKGNECTSRPAFLVQRRLVNAFREPDGYTHDGEGFAKNDDPDAPYLTDQELLDMECAIETWETVAGAASREDADEYGTATAHRYRNGWRSYSIPSVGALGKILHGKGPSTVMVMAKEGQP